jgi:hypothetical protein
VIVGSLETAGERLAIECDLDWVAELLKEGAGGEIRETVDADATIRISIESRHDPFDVEGWELLTRGAWRRGRDVVLRDPCTAGFDLHVSCTSQRALFRYRWRPPRRTRAASLLLRSRFHLLARAVLVQYPALWWAGRRGRVPLHASACTDGTSTALVTAPSGVGRSTFVLEQVRGGAKATGDNLAVADDATVWGLVEPLRIGGGSGRRMPHGRNEAPLPDRVGALSPDRIVVLQRGSADHAELVACSPESAARALVTSTYMAGELRRYWAFAATLAAGTGVGPAHPALTDVAAALTQRLPCFSLLLGRTPASSLAHAFATPEVAA